MEHSEDPEVKVDAMKYEIVVKPKQRKFVFIKASVEGFQSAARMSTCVLHG